MSTFRVLLVDDDDDDVLITRELLAEANESRFEVDVRRDAVSGLAALLEAHHDVCLLDYRLGADTGIDLLREAKALGCEVPVIMLTGARDPMIDRAALDAGAHDYLVKGRIDALLLERSIRYVMRHTRDEQELRRYAHELEDANVALERARTELTLRNQELARLDEQKNQLLGMAAHDLRNPLGVVLGFATYALDGLGKMPLEELRDVLQRIRASSHFMRTLVDDLLDLAAIEAGTLDIECDCVDPRDFMREKLAVNGPLASQKQIELLVEVAADVPPVWVDPVRFEQALDNVISNAIKYSEPGRHVWLTVTPAGPDEVVFSVRDEGRGMTQKFLEHMFEPFAKEARTGTRGEKSTGLGLAIVRRIVDAHGGRIRVESEVGKGTTFHLVVPTATAARSGTRKVAAA